MEIFVRVPKNKIVMLYIFNCKHFSVKGKFMFEMALKSFGIRALGWVLETGFVGIPYIFQKIVSQNNMS